MNVVPDPSFEAGIADVDYPSSQWNTVDHWTPGAGPWVLDGESNLLTVVAQGADTETYLRKQITTSVKAGQWVAARIPVQSYLLPGQARAAVTADGAVTLGDPVDMPLEKWVYPSVVWQAPTAAESVYVGVYVYDDAGDAPQGDMEVTSDAWIAAVGNTEAEAVAGLSRGRRGIAVQASVDFWAALPDTLPDWELFGVPLIRARVTEDASWTPYQQGELTVALDDELADAIDPTNTPANVRAVVTYLRYDSPDLTGQTQHDWDLAVRRVTRNHRDGTMTVSVASNERFLDTYPWTDVAPETWPAGTPLEDIIQHVMTTAGLAFTRGATTFQVPEAVAWEVGVSGGDFLRPLCDLAGLKLLCDQEEFRLYQPDDVVRPGAAGPVMLAAEELIEHEVLTSQDGVYADDVLVIYEWTDAAGAVQRQAVTSTSSGALHPSWHIERVQGRYPGPGAADAIRDRLAAWRHERTIRTLWDFDIRPGIVVNVEGHAGTTGGRVHSVEYNADGTMDITQTYE